MAKQLIGSGMRWEQTVGYSRAVKVDDRVWVGGTAPVGPDGEVDPDVGSQARRVFAIIGAALAEAGASFSDVVRCRIYLVDAADRGAVLAVYTEVLGEVRPALTGVVVAALLDPRWQVEVEVDAVVSAP